MKIAIIFVAVLAAILGFQNCAQTEGVAASPTESVKTLTSKNAGRFVAKAPSDLGAFRRLVAASGNYGPSLADFDSVFTGDVQARARMPIMAHVDLSGDSAGCLTKAVVRWAYYWKNPADVDHQTYNSIEQIAASDLKDPSLFAYREGYSLGYSIGKGQWGSSFVVHQAESTNPANVAGCSSVTIPLSSKITGWTVEIVHNRMSTPPVLNIFENGSLITTVEAE